MPLPSHTSRRSSSTQAAVRRITLVSALVGLAACADPLEPDASGGRPLAAKGGAPVADAGVVSDLRGGGTASMRIQSDQRGPYRNNVDRVVSIMQGVGDWVLEVLDRRTTRAVFVDLTDAVADNAGPAPFSTALVKGRFIARSTLVQTGGMGAMKGLNSTMLSPLSFAFTHAGAEYGLRMNPNNHARTDWALVTCTAVADPAAPATSQCTAWHITPTGSHDEQSKNVAYLERITSSGSVMVGHYYMTFDIVITR